MAISQNGFLIKWLIPRQICGGRTVLDYSAPVSTRTSVAGIHSFKACLILSASRLQNTSWPVIGFAPALTVVESALDRVNVFRDKPAGTLMFNVPYRTVGRKIHATCSATLAVRGRFPSGVILPWEGGY
jgi:hypothetical protein